MIFYLKPNATRVQFDQIGQFFKSFGKKVLYKLARKFGNFMGKFENHNFFLEKMLFLLFGQTFGGSLGYFLVSPLASGRTAHVRTFAYLYILFNCWISSQYFSVLFD